MIKVAPRIISVREHPDYAQTAIKFFQSRWPIVPPHLYDEGINLALVTEDSIPQWYLLELNGQLIGCAGLIDEELITRKDIFPWLCALYIDEDHRGQNYASLLIEKIKSDTKKGGFDHLYLVSDLKNYYQKFGFSVLGDGEYPWGDLTKIYQIKV